MNQPPPQITPVWLLTAMAVAVWASLTAWTAVALRWRRGLAVLPYQPRRQVPWRGLDLAVVLIVYVAALGAVGLLIETVFADSGLTRVPSIQNVEQSNSAHTVARLLAEGSPAVLLICGLATVVVAPIAEEFLFRLLLQGYLEAKQRRWRRAMPTLQRLGPAGTGVIVLTSFLFARMHFRVDAPAMNVHFLMLLVAGNAAASLLTMLLAVWVLRMRVGATATDLGWVPGKFFADVKLGLATFAALAAPIYGMQLALSQWLPKYLAPDPFVLFPFALVLGTLFYRTHRLVPSIILHMSLNATSLAIALKLMWK